MHTPVAPDDAIATNMALLHLLNAYQGKDGRSVQAVGIEEFWDSMRRYQAGGLLPSYLSEEFQSEKPSNGFLQCLERFAKEGWIAYAGGQLMMTLNGMLRAARIEAPRSLVALEDRLRGILPVETEPKRSLLRYLHTLL